MSKRSRLRKQVKEDQPVAAPVAMAVGEHTFPAFTGLDAAFGADLSAYPAFDSIPDEFRHGSKFNRIASSLFFSGGRLSDHGIDFKPGVDRAAAMTAIRSLLCSFAPKHEHKEAAVAWCLSEWTQPTA